MVAAPLIAHPLFYWMGVTGGESIGALKASSVHGIYVAFAVVALAVDRRALLVSALAYVLLALLQLFQNYKAIELNVALTALIVGSALLGLSAYWQVMRSLVFRFIPAKVQIKLPPTN